LPRRKVLLAASHGTCAGIRLLPVIGTQIRISATNGGTSGINPPATLIPFALPDLFDRRSGYRRTPLIACLTYQRSPFGMPNPWKLWCNSDGGTHVPHYGLGFFRSSGVSQT
jgi:hypothetical protein